VSTQYELTNSSSDIVYGVHREKKAISQSDCSPIHVMVTLLYRTLQSTLGHDTLIWRT